MKLESRFEMGQVVYYISRGRKKMEVECGFCGGAGRIDGLDGQESSCPKCHRRGYNIEYQKLAWNVRDPHFTIGQIRVQAGHNPEERYMCHETGIGSGTLYDGDNMFATREEAQAECDLRNKGDVP